MNEFKNKLEQFEKQCQGTFATFECSEAEYGDNTYVKVRTDVLDLYAKAQTTLPPKELAAFKISVIDFLCRNCGNHLDADLLDTYTPRVLSEKDMDYIFRNSALARWL